MGLLSLVLIGAAAGSIYYYQFIVPQAKNCAAPVHRVIFMRALVQETPFNGFAITGAAILNETGSPLPVAANYTSQDPRLNFTGVRLENYTVTSPRTIEANVGDRITIYVLAVNATIPPQYSSALGHGLGIDQFSIPNPIRVVRWGTWASITFTVTNEGVSTYRCLHSCSDQHASMTGSLVVGCA